MRERFSPGGGDVLQGGRGRLQRCRARPGANAGSPPRPSYLSSASELQRAEAKEELLPGAVGVSPAPPHSTPALNTGLRGCWGEVADMLLHSSVCPARD